MGKNAGYLTFFVCSAWFALTYLSISKIRYQKEKGTRVLVIFIWGLFSIFLITFLYTMKEITKFNF